jgi:hypothetical protein
MKNKFLATAFLALLSVVGCHAQPAPTPGYNTTWTWTPPTTGACTTNCNYIVSTLTVAAGITSCPPSTGQYVPQQTTSTALATTSWTQTNTTGQTICAVVSAYFSGATSVASSPSNVVTNPALPLAPGVPSGNSAVADVVKPQTPGPEPTLQASRNLTAPGTVYGVVARR